MKKNYESLLSQITELYIKAKEQVFYWDKRCDDEKGEDIVEIYCNIRNAYAHEAAAYFKILRKEVLQEDIENMHETAWLQFQKSLNNSGIA